MYRSRSVLASWIVRILIFKIYILYNEASTTSDTRSPQPYRIRKITGNARCIFCNPGSVSSAALITAAICSWVNIYGTNELWFNFYPHNVSIIAERLLRYMANCLIQVIRCERLFSDSPSRGAIHFLQEYGILLFLRYPVLHWNGRIGDKHFGSSAYLKWDFFYTW